jgi:prolyl 4-hydroxylase
MKTHKINEKNLFLKGWYINQNVCDDIVNFFEKRKDLQQTGKLDTGKIDKQKKSTDISVPIDHQAILPYSFELRDVVEEYKKIFPVLDCEISTWAMKELINIQKYNPKEGFTKWHTENSNLTSSHRLLVFMTYLNDVEEGGETEWFHQKLKIKPEKGLTIIWPADWTHLHKGCVADKEVKYIATGWFSYLV